LSVSCTVYEMCDIATFQHPSPINAPDEGIPEDICSLLGVCKLESLQSSANCLMISSVISTQYTRVTDRQPEPHDSIYIKMVLY